MLLTNKNQVAKIDDTFEDLKAVPMLNPLHHFDVCSGCIAQDNADLCNRLPKCTEHDVIWIRPI